MGQGSGATAALARKGLLDRRKHTSNALIYLQQLPQYRGAALYCEQPAVTDGQLITASGTASFALVNASAATGR